MQMFLAKGSPLVLLGLLARQEGGQLRNLQRIERLEVDNPPIRYLTNCAIVLGCELEDLIEPAWREWKSFT